MFRHLQSYACGPAKPVPRLLLVTSGSQALCRLPRFLLFALHEEVAFGVFRIGKSDRTIFHQPHYQHVGRDGVFVVPRKGMVIGGDHPVIGFF